MRCANIFCVYWLDDKCLLKEISLDIQGNCENCIYVNVDLNELNDRRKEMLNNELGD